MMHYFKILKEIYLKIKLFKYIQNQYKYNYWFVKTIKLKIKKLRMYTILLKIKTVSTDYEKYIKKTVSWVQLSYNLLINYLNNIKETTIIKWE